MNYLSVDKLAKRYADKTLFENVSFGIDQGQKTALVGLNGTGKSTLFRILMSQETADDGDFSFNNKIRISMLPQEPRINDHYSILDYVLGGNDAVSILVRDYENALVTGDQTALDKLLPRMDQENAWDFESRAQQILGQLGIHDLLVPANTLSGGQQKRVALARVLIESPDFLLLDEPTNHLDLEVIEWLEKYLSTQKMTLLLVTHDRYFLEAVTNDILELDNSSIYRYKGSYSYFLEKKVERQEIEAREIDKAKNLMRKELDWIRRQPKARGTKAKYRVEAFDDLKKQASKRIETNEVSIGLAGQRLGRKILELEEISKGYGELRLIENFSYTFKKNDRVGIVGKNGTGKSTLVNILSGSLTTDSGQRTVGETVVFGHYKQEGLEFATGSRVIEEVTDIAEYIELSDGSRVTASQLLQQFNFSREKQYDYTEKLSGGEKRRLQLLKVLMGNPNFLILDEPTNDLDLQTLNTLEEYLEKYRGCLVVVTHDRYFLDRLVDHLFVLDGHGAVKDFPGNFTDYRNVAFIPKKKEQPTKKSNAAKTAKRTRKLSYNEQREFDNLEGEIAKLEEEKLELSQQLSQPNQDYEKLVKLGTRLEEIKAAIEVKELRWLELSEKIE